ncbi:MAG: 3-hydroxypropionyl-coenzyme A dehydratase [Promethearchaeota archaeon]|nr:MAG: 3-hydroxypropionyl-coenzyme A dehydratase [Candidatus Lokiarchaeota archaeon]
MSESKNFEHLMIEYNEEGNYAVVLLNRPNKLNALNNHTLEEIADALAALEVDPRARCVVLRGTRDFTKKPAFSAGADLSERGFPDLDRDNLRHQSHAMYRRHKCYNQIEKFPKPLIAAVDGYALGGGFELVLVCDIVIASKRSTFGFPEIRRGIFPANGGTQRLVHHLGKYRVKEMMFFGEQYSAEKMHEWGIVSYLIDDNKFEEFVDEKASWLGGAPTNSLFVIKKAIDYGSQVPLDIGLQFEQMGYAINSTSRDVAEGVSAFLEKRKPEFQGK